MSSQEVAKTIADQIGNMAFMMMGTKKGSLMATEKGLKFQIGKNAKGVTHIMVDLEPSDTYKVSFYKVRGVDCKVLAQVEDVYVDVLKRTIEQNTGLYLSL